MSGQIRSKRSALVTNQAINSEVTSDWHVHQGESQIELEVKYTYAAGTGWTLTIETQDDASAVLKRGGEEDSGSGVRTLAPLVWTRVIGASENLVWPIPLVAQSFRVKIVATGSPTSSDKAAVSVLTAQV